MGVCERVRWGAQALAPSELGGPSEPCVCDVGTDDGDASEPILACVCVCVAGSAESTHWYTGCSPFPVQSTLFAESQYLPNPRRNLAEFFRRRRVSWPF